MNNNNFHPLIGYYEKVIINDELFYNCYPIDNSANTTYTISVFDHITRTKNNKDHKRKPWTKERRERVYATKRVSPVWNYYDDLKALWVRLGKPDYYDFDYVKTISSFKNIPMINRFKFSNMVRSFNIDYDAR